MSTNYKPLIITAWALSVLNSICIGIIGFRIRDMHEESQRQVPRSELSVSFDGWAQGESTTFTHNIIWYAPTFGRAIDVILSWTSELSASIAKP